MSYKVKALTAHEGGGYHASGRFWPFDEEIIVDRVSAGMLEDPLLEITEVEIQVTEVEVPVSSPEGQPEEEEEEEDAEPGAESSEPKDSSGSEPESQESKPRGQRKASEKTA